MTKVYVPKQEKKRLEVLSKDDVFDIKTQIAIAKYKLTKSGYRLPRRKKKPSEERPEQRHVTK